jgi:hypothetical protein
MIKHQDLNASNYLIFANTSDSVAGNRIARGKFSTSSAQSCLEQRKMLSVHATNCLKVFAIK